MQEQKEQKVVVQMGNRGRDDGSYYYWDDIHRPCLPKKDKSEYADASPNCFFEVCETHLVLIVESSLI